jgi:Ca-activated chloride channel homolog
MLGYRFGKFAPTGEGETPFDRLFKIFKELVTITSGDVEEALQWLTEVDRQHGLTDKDYSIGDFIQELKDRGYLQERGEGGGLAITPKTEQNIRKSALDQIFGKLKKTGKGNHKTPFTGAGDEPSSDLKEYSFGDGLDQLAVSESIQNAQVNHGIESFFLTEQDLQIRETEHKTGNATVLMIDISHSMILYGEDRITPAKKVAMALSELITTKYPKDSLDVIVFGNDAWPISIKDLPYLQVGPFHTNTVAGLELAMDILRRKKNKNKQIFMITDGKPTCLKENGKYYKNSYGLDKKILNHTYNLAAHCRKLKMPITTFMVASDPYLQDFVREFTQINQGKAYYTGLKGLGDLVFEDYEKNRKKSL